MLRNHDNGLPHRASGSIPRRSSLFGCFILVTLMIITGDSVSSQHPFPPRPRLLALSTPSRASVWKPGLAKGPVASYVRATPVPLALTTVADLWDNGTGLVKAFSEITKLSFYGPSGGEPELPLILRAGLMQAAEAPVIEPIQKAPQAAMARSTAPSAAVTAAPVAEPAIRPEPSLSLPLRPAASIAPDRVVAPSINLDQPVISVGWHQETINSKLVSVWDVAQYAVGWHKNSKYPGQGGNVVLAGHNNVYGEVFRRLEDLHVGDLITVYAGGRGYDYAVDSTVIVKEEGATPEEKVANARWIGSFPDERLTLVACYPYTGNSHRIIIIARPHFKIS